MTEYYYSPPVEMVRGSRTPTPNRQDGTTHDISEGSDYTNRGRDGTVLGPQNRDRRSLSMPAQYTYSIDYTRVLRGNSYADISTSVQYKTTSPYNPHNYHKKQYEKEDEKQYTKQQQQEEEEEVETEDQDNIEEYEKEREKVEDIEAEREIEEREREEREREERKRERSPSPLSIQSLTGPRSGTRPTDSRTNYPSGAGTLTLKQVSKGKGMALERNDRAAAISSGKRAPIIPTKVNCNHELSILFYFILFLSFLRTDLNL